MVGSTLTRYFSFFLFLSSFFLSPLPTRVAAAFVEKPSFSFSFDGFQKDPTFDAEFELLGDADVSDSVVRMKPNPNSTTSGVLLHRTSIDFGRKPSFSTDFSFSVSSSGIAFLIAPANVRKESFTRNRFGISPGVFAVEFDTKIDPNSYDPNASHIGIDIGSSVSIETFNLSALNLSLSSGEKLHSWIDFDGEMKILEVRLNNSGQFRPSNPYVSYPIDLSGLIWQDAMFVGIVSSSSSSSSSFSSSSSSGRKPTTQASKVYSWSFRLKHAMPYLMHSNPLDPVQYIKGQNNPTPLVRREESAADHVPMILMALAFGSACGAAVAFVVLLMWSSAVDRRPIAPVDEYQPHQVEFGYEKIVVVKDGLVDHQGIKPTSS